MSSDPEFTHPELENIPFFTGKIPFPPTTQEPIRVQSVDDNLVVHKSDKTQMEIEEANYLESGKIEKTPEEKLNEFQILRSSPFNSLFSRTLRK